MKLDHWFRRGDQSWETLPDEMRNEFPDEIWPLIETDFKYEGHLGRQRTQIDRMSRQEGRRISPDIDFTAIPALKKEAQIRFTEILPETLGQAGRIPGITPADIAILTIWLEKRERSGSGAI